MGDRELLNSFKAPKSFHILTSSKFEKKGFPVVNASTPKSSEYGLSFAILWIPGPTYPLDRTASL